MYKDVTAPGRDLHRRFTALGDMRGKTIDDIVNAVGRPTSISSTGGGQTLLQWQATGCHIALLFASDGKFVRITHEFAHYAPAPAAAGCLTITVALPLIALLAAAILAIPL